MAHHSDSALRQGGRLLLTTHASFQLDSAHVSFLHHANAVVDALRNGLLVGAVGHISDDQRILGSATFDPATLTGTG